jgi:hypothetical protein
VALMGNFHQLYKIKVFRALLEVLMDLVDLEARFMFLANLEFAELERLADKIRTRAVF